MTVLKAKIGGTFQSVLSGYASNVYTGPNPPADPNVEFWVDTDAVLPVVPWTPLPLAATWTAFQPTTWSNPAYRKIGDEVQIRGVVSSSTNQAANAWLAAATLPVGFRPPKNIMMTGAYASTALPRIDVESATGNIVVYWTAAGTIAFVSFDQIRFSVTA